MKLAFLGIGRMGERMVPHLIEGGFEVHVWNRTASKARALEVLGAHPADSPEACVAEAGFTVTMLTDGPAVEALMSGSVADAVRPGSIVIDMSSISPSLARQHAGRWQARGIPYLDAPVSGGTKGAEAASLAIMVGGDEDDFLRALPVLTCLGRPTHMGPPGSGQAAKLCNQIIVTAAIGGVAEAILFAKTFGVDPRILREALKGGFADSRILEEHGKRMIERDFTAGGILRNHTKDLRATREAARELGLTLPLTGLMDALFGRLEELEGGEIDHSALILLLEKENARPQSD